MKNGALLKLLKEISSWSELETLISRLPTAINRGKAFEEFCKAFFILDPVFQFKKVYRQSEIPYSLRERLGYPNVQDIEIDGLAVTSDDKLYAYQAKFRTERNNTPTLRELSTFFTMSDKADWRIVISNANKLPSSIDDRVRQGRVLSDSLDKLDADFFNRLRLYLKEQQIVPPKAKTPRKDQNEAIDKALSHFVGNDRGQLILPCGTGKTLTAMWIAEKLSGKRILIMLPSLALLSQTLREWAANTLFKPFRYLCLCSDTTVDLGNDSPIENLYEIDVPVSTDAEVVADFLSNKHSTPSILFSTYQSSKVLSEATIKTNTCFDVAIFDEAHRTTGTSVGIWNIALDDNKVPVKKRIFMTATPRIYLPHIIKKAQANDVLICSMDDEKIYGKPFYEMTFGNAIEEQLITDYKVIVISVTDSEVKNIIKNSGNIIVDNEHEWDAKGLVA
jgi:predicted helicase